MTLIGDDMVPPFIPRTKASKHVADNFQELQNLGHTPNSKDFSDSPFADRVQIEQCAYCGQTLMANGIQIGAYQTHYDGQCLT